VFHRSDLDHGFFRTGLFVFPEIVRRSVSAGMPGLPVPFMLTVAVLAVMLMIVSTLDLLEGISDLFFICLIRRKPEAREVSSGIRL
jgi:hypothetical protein